MANINIRFPNAPSIYDQRDQDQFRRDVERALAQGVPLGVTGGGSGTLTVLLGGGALGANIGTLDFASADFDLTESPSGEVNIGLDASVSRVGHVHDAADVTTGIFARSRLPSQVAYEDEANTFTLAQVIGTDPGGTDLLRVGGAVTILRTGGANYQLALTTDNTATKTWNFAAFTDGALYLSRGDDSNIFVFAVDGLHIETGKGIFLATNNALQLHTTVNQAAIRGNATPQIVFLVGAADRMGLSSTDLSPSTARGLTLGTSSFPWGNAFLGDGLLVGGGTLAIADDEIRLTPTGRSDGVRLYHVSVGNYALETTGTGTFNVGTPASGGVLQLVQGGVVKASFAATAITFFDDLLFSADNTLDIGASGANRPRSGYFGTSVVVGTDPTGPELLRVGGTARFGGTAGAIVPASAGLHTLGTASLPWGALRLSDPVDASLGSTGHAFQIGASSGVNLIMDGNEIMARDNGAVNSLVLQAEGGTIVTGATVVTPIAIHGGTLGTSTLPWAHIYSGAFRLYDSAGISRGSFADSGTSTGLSLGRIDGTAAPSFIDFNTGATAVDYDTRIIGSGGTGAIAGGTLDLIGATVRYQSTFGATRFTFTDTLNTSAVDFTIGSLGRFDSADVPTDQQLLVYHAGGINKWQAESIQFVRGGGDFHAALLSDNTAIAYVLLDPGAGADSPVGAPPVPATPTVTVGHKAFVLDVAGYVKPADFRYFEWEHCTGASCVSWGALAFTTSHTLVHSRLTTSDVKRYRVRAVDRAGNASAFATTGDNTVVAQSDTQAFAGIIAGEIAAVDLTALAGDIGILVTGQVRGVGNTYGVNFGGVGGIPGTWTAGINFENTSLGSMTRFLNFDSTASGTFLKHERLEVNFDGSFKMYQTSSQPMFKLDSSDFLLQNDAASPTQGLLIDGTLPGTWTRYFNLNGSGNMVKHDLFELRYDGSMFMTKKVVFLTSGTSWTVPADFNPFLNSVELIGGGGGGAGGVTNTRGGGGGGGGGWRKIIAFNPGSRTTIPYTIGAAGAAGAAGGSGGNGGNTTWDVDLIAGGGSGSTSASGGGGGSGIGGFGLSGGTGGAASSGTGNRGGGGGGGASGSSSVGSTGGAGSTTAGGTGGAGGNPNGGAGGAGGVDTDGGVGGNGTGWTANPGGSQAGSGGGGGGGDSTGPGIVRSGGAGGNYGAGGGGGSSSTGDQGTGGAGTQGIIVITYFPIGSL